MTARGLDKAIESLEDEADEENMDVDDSLEDSDVEGNGVGDDEDVEDEEDDEEEDDDEFFDEADEVELLGEFFLEGEVRKSETLDGGETRLIWRRGYHE